MDAATDGMIEQIVKHEWAHYYCLKVYKDSGHGHGMLFKKVCEKIGCYEDGWCAKREVKVGV